MERKAGSILRPVRLACLLAFVLASFAISVQAAMRPGPDAFGYSVAYTNASFTNITADGERILEFEIDAAETVPIGFNFNFYGSNYTEVSISLDGVLSFGGQHIDWDNTNITTTAMDPDLPAICVMWADYETVQGGDAVYYRTHGTPGNRQFIVQWNQMYPVDTDGFDTITFQARLFETNNSIMCSYPDITVSDDLAFGGNRGTNATVGIRDRSGQTNNRTLMWSYRPTPAQVALSNKLHIIYTRPNRAPVAVNDSAVTGENQPVTINVLANDRDIDGNVLSIVSVTQPTRGVASVTNQMVRYVPANNFTGQVAFTYRATDGRGAFATGTVNVAVSGVNDPPIVRADNYTLSEDLILQVNAPGVLTNDNDPEGAQLSVTLMTNVIHGTLSLSANGAFTYTPAANYNGLDSFAYRASDGSIFSTNIVVRLTVTSVNDPPIAQGGTPSTMEDVPTAVTLRGVDVDHSTLTYAIVSPPDNGLLTGSGTNRTYRPFNNYHGPDSVIFSVTDGGGLSSTATVVITVSPVNEFSPVAGNDVVEAARNYTLVITNQTLLENDFDNDIYDTLILESVSASSTNGGTVMLDSGIVYYTPRTNYMGNDQFTYNLSDGLGGTAVGTVRVKVTTGIRIQSVTQSTNGTTMVSFSAPTGATYQVERSLNLLNWTSLGSPTQGIPGWFGFEDAQLPAQPIRFYRITTP